MVRWLGLALFLALGCGNDGAELRLDLRTDLIPAVDYVGTSVRLVGEEVGEMRFAFGNDVLEGYRIAHLRGLSKGTQEVEIVVLGPTGVPIHTRMLTVELDGSVAATVLVTRSCLDIACEEGRTCNGGRCVDPACSLENLDACELECTEAGDCEGDTGSCGGHRCTANQCIVDIEAGCADVEWCHPDEGCIARDTGGDPVLTLIVDGPGRVSGGGQTCGPDETCEITVERNAEVTLVSEETGDPFWGWIGGDCDDRTMPCTTTINAPRTIRAVFGSTVGDVTTMPTVDGAGEPFRIRLDDVLPMADGSMLVADTSADRVWRVTPGGVVEPFAGSGTAGYLDGPALDAGFTNPRGLTADDTGIVYVADGGNNRIRRVLLDGTVETFAGNGTGTSSDGALLEAGIPTPYKLVWRPDGTIFVTDGSGDLRILDATTVRSVDAPGIGDRQSLALGDDGSLYWSAGSGIYRLPSGSDEAQVHAMNPCGRSGGWLFSVAWSPTLGVVESVAGGGAGLCRVAPDGTTRLTLLYGGDDDGPDYAARTSLAGAPIRFAPDGRLVVVDDWPGISIRVLTPR